MATDGNINLVNLDFDGLKESFKDFLRSQKQFNDYDFDGSNMNVLLDVMAYNSYLNSYYLNMVGSEMFLDSAQLRDSIISHAKELNYTPRSFRSSSALINIAITPSNTHTTSVTIPRGATLTSKVGSNTFTYTIQDTLVLTQYDANNTFHANNVTIYEGALFTDTFVYNSQRSLQRFVLTNPTIDTTSLRVYVTEDNAGNAQLYSQANSYLGLGGESKAFFVQAAENDLYEITFGNGTQGRTPKNGSVVAAVYQVCSGELPNGAALFSMDGTVDGHSNVKITTVTSSTGGAIHESSREIKKNAPKFYQTQERAVSAQDYKTLLQIAYPEIEALNAYGGEQDDPPRYGKVVLSAKIRGLDNISRDKIEVYKSYLNDRSPLTIDPVFVDPEYLDLKVTSHAKYSVSSVKNSVDDIISAIKTKIRLFNEFNLNGFNTTFRYSQLVADIDEVPGLLSNDTEVLACKRYAHTLNSDNPFTIKFRQKLDRITPDIENPNYRSYHTLSTSTFTYNDSDTGTVITAELEDDGYGVVNVVDTKSPAHPIVIPGVGTIDYDNGTIAISKLNITGYDGLGITFKVRTDSADISSSLNDIIRIPDDAITVTIEGETR